MTMHGCGGRSGLWQRYASTVQTLAAPAATHSPQVLTLRGKSRWHPLFWKWGGVGQGGVALSLSYPNGNMVIFQNSRNHQAWLI